MDRKSVFMIFAIYILLGQKFGLHGMSIPNKIDIIGAARVLRTAIINSSYYEVQKIISFYEVSMPDRIVDIFYDTNTSIGKNTLIEDLFCYRPQILGNHVDILMMLVSGFKAACFFQGMSIEKVNRATVLWMLFYANQDRNKFPNLINVKCFSDDKSKSVAYLDNLLLTFFEFIKQLCGSGAVEKILHSSLNGRGYTVDQYIFHQLPAETQFPSLIKNIQAC